MSRNKLLTKRQREKQLNERNQAQFKKAYIKHVSRSAHIGIRHFANVGI